MTTQPDGTIIYTPFPDYELTDLPAGADTVRTTYRLGGWIVAVQTKVGAAAGAFYFTYTDHLGNITAVSTTAGVYVADSRAWYDPFGAFISDPTVNPPDVTPVPSSNPTISSHGFTGHRHNNTGTNNLGLIYMNARYYMPEIGRFISPDTIVPEPANPQSFNRYSYVLNSPMNYTDPSGHCAEPATFTICAVATAALGPVVVVGAVAFGALVVVADIALPTFNPGADAIEFLEGITQQVGNQVTHLLSESKSPKPLTKDEETLVGRIDAIPGWLDDHPDLAEDAEKVAAGERLPKGRDHIKEAKERIGSLDTAVEHLSRVRRSRDAGAQVEIDAALERAREYRQRLVDIVGDRPK